jgi:hypothetical protein
MITLVFKKTDAIPMYSGNNYNLYPGEKGNFEDKVAERLLTDFPDNFAVAMDYDPKSEDGKRIDAVVKAAKNNVKEIAENNARRIADEQKAADMKKAQNKAMR